MRPCVRRRQLSSLIRAECCECAVRAAVSWPPRLPGGRSFSAENKGMKSVHVGPTTAAPFAMLAVACAAFGVSIVEAGADVQLLLAPDLPTRDTAVALHAAGILARQIRQRCNSSVSLPNSAAPAAVVIELGLDSSHGEEGFAILNGTSTTPVAIVGGDRRGLLYGVGKFLRTSRFDGSQAARFVPGSWRGSDAPRLRGSFRCAYLALHLSNYYQVAPEEQVSAYLEDLALWGVNAVVVPLPGPGSMVAGESSVKPGEPQVAALVNRSRALLSIAKSIGLNVGVTMVPNQGYNADGKGDSPFPFTPFPDPLHVRGHFGALTCAFKGEEYLLGIRRQKMALYRDIGLDFMMFWPYDEGGCGCKDDWPWGGKGYPRLASKMQRMASDMYPGIWSVVSTWLFDKPVVDSSEYAGLDAFIKAEKAAENATFSFAMVDDHGALRNGHTIACMNVCTCLSLLLEFAGDFPRWPLEQGNGTVGGLPLVNFPEISMFGRNPWSGWGANPLPSRFEGLWTQTEGKVVGGMPYSEGIYEDMNAVIAYSHYWSDRDSNATIREYIEFEFSRVPAHVDAVVTAISLLERTWVLPAATRPPDPDQLPTYGYNYTTMLPWKRRAYELLESVDRELTLKARTAWRWRMLMLRAQIDWTLSSNGGVMGVPQLCAAFDELRALQFSSGASPVLACPS